MATHSPYPITVGDANDLVVDQIERLNDIADDLIDQTQEAIDGLEDVQINMVSLDPRFQWDDGDLNALLHQLGELPSADLDHDWLTNVNLGLGNDDFDFNPQILAMLSETLPEYLLPAMPALPAMPEEPADPGEPTALVMPDAPTLPTYTAPEVDVLGPMPEYLDYTAGVPFPTLRPIVLPDPPVTNLDVITFDGVRPVFDAEVPDFADYSFTPAVYEPLFLDELRDAIMRVLQGGTGIPADVEEAIFEQAREREIELGNRDVDQVTNEYAARGWKIPPGALNKRIDRARTDASFKVSQLNREQFITRMRLEVEQFRTVIATAVGLEEMWIGAFAQSERIRFEAAQMQLSFAIQIFNAEVTKYNAEQAMYQTDAVVYKTRIEAEMAKLEAYRAELEGLRLIGELNMQDVKIYTERLNALVINAEIYKARVLGYTEQYRAIEAKTNVFKAQLESNVALAQVYESQVRAYGIGTDAQKSRDERFQIKANIFSTKVDAKKAEYETALAGYNNHFKIAEMRRDTFIANSQRVSEYISAESGRIQALVNKYEAFAAQIGAKSEVEKARYTLMLSFAQAQIERMKAAADILLKNGEINIQSALQSANLMIRARETAATTLAQLSAGLTSAASVNASVSSSFSNGFSYSYNGELDIN